MVSDVKYQNFLKFINLNFFCVLEVTNKTEVTTPDTPIAGRSARRGCKTRSMTSSSSPTPVKIFKPTLEAQVENARKADEKQKVGAAASVSESESEKPVAVEKIETDEKDTAAAAETNTSPTELKNNAEKWKLPRITML